MSAWDDSWGHPGQSSGSRSQVTDGKIPATRRGAERLPRPTPLTTDLTRSSRGDTVASATILRLPTGTQATAPTDICPECGWMRWEHALRPEFCRVLR